MWKGPTEGVTQSLLGKFLECPYRFYLYAILGLEEPRVLEDNLMWGDSYHVGLEYLLETKDLDTAKTMAIKYLKEKYPMAPLTFQYSIIEMLELFKIPTEEITTELKINEDILLPYSSRPVKVRGKMDGLSDTKLYEHKCKGTIKNADTIAEIPYDLQCNLYAYFAGRSTVQYDLIRIPEAQWKLPYRRADETDEGFITRIYYNHAGPDYPIRSKRSLWVNHLQIDLDYIDQVMDYTFYPLCEKLWDWYELVTAPKFDIEDPACYGSLFYRSPIRNFDPSRTEKYRCSYWEAITDNYDFSGLTKVRSYFPELPV